MKNDKRKIICLFLMITIIFSIVIFSFSQKRELKEDNITGKINTIAIMVEESENSKNYRIYRENSWPKEHYRFNKLETLKNCKDKSNENIFASSNLNNLKDISFLRYNALEYSAIMRSDKTAFCTLYFDIDNIKPTGSMYISNTENKQYTNNRFEEIYITTDSDDVIEYCLKKNNNSSDCEWKVIPGYYDLESRDFDSSIKEEGKDYSFIVNEQDVEGNLKDGVDTYDFGTTNEQKTVYLFLKDGARNISNSINKSIILDTVKPTATITGGDAKKSSTQTVNLSCSDNNNLVGYYWGTTEPNTNTIFNSINPNQKYWSKNEILTNPTGTYYLGCKDIAGNIEKTSITFVKYTTYNMLLKLNGIENTYTTINYDRYSLYDYYIKKNTSLSTNDICTKPYIGNTLKGYNLTIPSTSNNTLISNNFTINENRNISCWYNRLTYTVNVTPGTGGNVTIETLTQSGNFVTANENETKSLTVRYGDQVKATANAKSGYSFKEWTGGYLSGSTNPTTGERIYNNKTIIASFNETAGFKFTYTGGFTYYDGDNFIEDYKNNTTEREITITNSNWKVNFLTSGILKVNSITSNVDIFLVGGGGGGSFNEIQKVGAGGGGGYTKTISNKNLSIQSYYVTIGAGGAAGGKNGIFNDGKWATEAEQYGHNGGSTKIETWNGISAETIEDLIVSGGQGGQRNEGGAGGSGGGGGSITHGGWRPDMQNNNMCNFTNDDRVSLGGVDGSNGLNGKINNNANCSGTSCVVCQSSPTNISTGGTGQNNTTKEFGESNGTLYAGGGDGSLYFYSRYTYPNCFYAGKIYRASDYNNNYIGGRSGESGGPNTGGGGGGGFYYNHNQESENQGCLFPVTQNAGAGGSGIAIIRNHRS